jgi:uncharacterized protein
MPFTVIDSHAHCGIQDRFPPQSLEDYLAEVKGSDISGVAMFAPVMEIYDRNDPDFVDTSEWQQRRRQANSYLLSLGEDGRLEVFPFFFIWNDFAADQLTHQHRGIKWHRHGDEPRYHYEDPRCAEAIDAIRRCNLPVVFEEEWEHTVHFIDELASGVRVIIPHCGLLNGGFERFCRHQMWERPNIYTDTSLVPPHLVSAYVQRYGCDRILFGSDFPFGDPVYEYRKILRLGLSEREKAAILAGNFQNLMSTLSFPARDRVDP